MHGRENRRRREKRMALKFGSANIFFLYYYFFFGEVMKMLLAERLLTVKLLNVQELFLDEWEIWAILYLYTEIDFYQN